jgi:serine/threonine protein kinase
LRVVHAIGQGLEALHARGWVHRDVTPGNLLVDERDGVVKLADFGLARPIDDVPDEYDLTRAHETIGTPGYMSPEQWATPKSVQPPSDLFMLAGCLYFLLTGDPPFDRYGSPTRDFPADVDGPDDVRALLARAGLPLTGAKRPVRPLGPEALGGAGAGARSAPVGHRVRRCRNVLRAVLLPARLDARGVRPRPALQDLRRRRELPG